MSDLDLKERLRADFGKLTKCSVTGNKFRPIKTRDQLCNERTEAADRIAALEDALRPFAERKTIQESLRGECDDEWLGASADRRIEMLGDRRRKNDADILHARAVLGDA